MVRHPRHREQCVQRPKAVSDCGRPWHCKLTSLPGGWSGQGAGTCSCPHGSVILGSGPRVRAEGGTEECAWMKSPELQGCLRGLGWLSSQHPLPPPSGPMASGTEAASCWSFLLTGQKLCEPLSPTCFCSYPSSLSPSPLLPTTLLLVASRPQALWLDAVCLLNSAGPGTGWGPGREWGGREAELGSGPWLWY